MKTTHAVPLLVALLGLAGPATADDVIQIRVSYKVVISPVDGSRPLDGGGSQITDADLDEAVDEMNQMLELYERGYRMIRTDPVTEVGSIGGFASPDPSYYFDIDFFDDEFIDWRELMETDALNNQSTYDWNSAAINLYIVNGICGGQCSFPTGDFLIVIGGCSAANGETHLHEIGHFFDLCHTQGCPCGCCDTCVGQSDNVSDTILDGACWDQNDISTVNYGTSFDQLSAAQQEAVDDVFLNVMGYHNSACGVTTIDNPRMTEGQLDRWTDNANSFRAFACDGRTWFLQAGANCVASGSSVSPIGCFGYAVGQASAGDILLLRPGSYSQAAITITDPVTLRATRDGTAVIGIN